jgi:hypothetical protein
MESGLLSQLLPKIQGGAKKVGGGLLDFLKTPEADGLIQGLLAASQPSMTQPTQSFGGAIGNGMALGKQYRAQHDKTELDKASHELEKLYKTGMLDVHRGQLALDKTTKSQALAQKEAQRQAIIDIINAPSDNAGTAIGGISAEQKRRAAIALAGGRDDEAAKILSEKTMENEATRATLTQNQGVVQSIDNVLPVLDDLSNEKGNGIDIPYQNPWYFGGDLAANIASPQRQAEYHAEVAKAADQLIGALSLPKTNESISLVKKMLEKQPNEGDTAYRGRIKKLKKDLLRRRESAHKIAPSINAGMNPASSESSMNDDDPLGWR